MRRGLEMAPDAPPRKRSYFMQIHHASITLTQNASDFCQRPSDRSFCPGMKTLFFPYFRCLPGNGKRIQYGSVTRLQKCGISGTLNLMDDLPLVRREGYPMDGWNRCRRGVVRRIHDGSFRVCHRSPGDVLSSSPLCSDHQP